MSAASDAAQALHEAQIAARNGDMPKAMRAASQATQLDPDIIEAWFILGSAALSANDFATAEQAFGEGARRVPQGTPTQAQFLTMRAQALITDGRAAEAVDSVRAAVAIGIFEPPGLIMAGAILTQAGLPHEALPLLKKATELTPQSAEAWFGLGGTQQFLGDLEAAETAFEAAIQCGMKTGRHLMLAHMSLAQLKRWGKADNHIARLEALQCRNSLDAACVAYSLVKEYDDIGDTTAAWDALQHGAMIAKSLDAWTPDNDAAIEAAWRSHFPPERIAKADTRPRQGPKRIFIVGLPRSGTTLIERILASHSQVQAIGELKTFSLAVKRLSGSATPALLDADTIAAAKAIDPMTLAEFYTRETAYLSDGSAYTIDKLPRNHEYLGLIRLTFPDAILIDVRRNPMDSLYGAYKLLFAHAHCWSYDQGDLAAHYVAYRSLMAYWQTCLGDGLIEVSLEAVIAEPDAQIRRLLDLCGLPFQAACLSPHESKGAVATASSAQVRKPINASGIGTWRRYATQLEPLRQRLLHMGIIDEAGNPLSAFDNNSV